MTERHSLICNVAIIAYRAGIGGVAYLGASGRSHYSLISVAKRRLYGVYARNLCRAYRAAGHGIISADVDAGRIYRVLNRGISRSMSESGCSIRNIPISAYRAGIGGVTTVGTGRSSHCNLIAVTKNGNDLLREDDICTDRALNAVGQTGINAGRSPAADSSLDMIRTKILTASITNIVAVIIGMSQRGNLALSNEYIQAK